MEKRNFISSLIENLFWLLPLVIVFILIEYIYSIFLILTIGYIIYLILDPLVCRLERIIRIRSLSVLIIISIFITPIYYGFSSLVYLISSEYDNIHELMTDKNAAGNADFTLSSDGQTVLGSPLKGSVIGKNCGTLVELNLEGTPTSLSEIKVVRFPNDGSAFTYYEGENKDIIDGCELPENNLYLTKNGSVLYNTIPDSNNLIMGFQFTVEGAEISSVSIGETITLKNVIDRIDDKILAITPDGYKQNVKDFFEDLNSKEKNESREEWGAAIFNLQNTVYIFSWIVNFIMYTFITFGFTFTLLMSAQKFKKSFIQLVPNRYFEMSLKIIDRISEQISAYVRGTLTAAVIVGALSIAGLEILCAITGMKHDYIIIVGIIAGVFNLIPFIGPMIGGIAGVLFFLISDHPPDFVQYYHILFIIGTFISVQLFDNFVSYPMISSSTVGMHPMFVIIVVLIGGSILGPFGMIISVPIAATLKVIVEELMWGFKNYRYL